MCQSNSGRIKFSSEKQTNREKYTQREENIGKEVLVKNISN